MVPLPRTFDAVLPILPPASGRQLRSNSVRSTHRKTLDGAHSLPNELELVWAEIPIRAQLRCHLHMKPTQAAPDFALAADRAVSTASRLGLPAWPRPPTWGPDLSCGEGVALRRGWAARPLHEADSSEPPTSVRSNPPSLQSSKASGPSGRAAGSGTIQGKPGGRLTASRDTRQRIGSRHRPGTHSPMGASWLSNEQRDMLDVLSDNRRAAAAHMHGRGRNEMEATTLDLSSTWRKAVDPKVKLSMKQLHKLVPPVTIEQVAGHQHTPLKEMAGQYHGPQASPIGACGVDFLSLG